MHRDIVCYFMKCGKKIHRYHKQTVQYLISKLADRTKIVGIIDSEGGYYELHQDLDQLGSGPRND